MTAPSPPRRRWFRYSLRTFFVVMTAFCVWLGVQVKWMRDRHKAIEWVTLHGHYIDSTSHSEGARDDNPAHRIHVFQPVAAPWPLGALGERGITAISVWDKDADLGDVSLKQHGRDIERLFPEAHVTVVAP
jgi:hypothetical protein